MSISLESAIVAAIRRVERVCGLPQKDIDTVCEMAMEWARALSFLAPDAVEKCCEWAIGNRSNQATALTLQNMLQAARVLMAGNQIQAVTSKEPNPGCGICNGLGYFYHLDGELNARDMRPYKLWRDAISGEFITEGYQQITRCECWGSVTEPEYDQAQVSELMKTLARLVGTIPNPRREQIAATRLLSLGWSTDEIIACWDTLNEERGGIVLWSNVMPEIGRRYFFGLIHDVSGEFADIARQIV